MKLLIAFLALVPLSGLSQFFDDLDFERGNVANPDSLNRVAFTNAFPTWQATSIAISQGFSEGGPVRYGYYNS